MAQIILVTGANRGIGKEVVRQLAGQGHTVLLSARSSEKAERAHQELDGLDNIVPVVLNVTDQADVDRLATNVDQQYGRLDVLINNAAIHYDSWQRVSNANLNTVAEAIDTNLYGPWRLTLAFLELLRRSERGRIVNVSSGAGALSSMTGGTPAYCMSKIGLNALTMMFSNELKRDGILVNAVCPGWVATDMGGGGGRPVEDGAEGIVWAATLPDDGPTGGFFRDGKRIDW